VGEWWVSGEERVPALTRRSVELECRSSASNDELTVDEDGVDQPNQQESAHDICGQCRDLWGRSWSWSWSGASEGRNVSLSVVPTVPAPQYLRCNLQKKKEDHLHI
jgi:hypothetical protein